MHTFILYDDTLPNADGTRVQLSGLRLDRFKKNPVMLYMHNRAEPHTHKPDGSEVIGRWENIRTEDNRLLADAVFDEKDPLAKKIARKVKEGFLKGASIGIDVHSSRDARSEKLPNQAGSTITKSTLLEASIVDIPQNEDALNNCALYQSFALGRAAKSHEMQEKKRLKTLQAALQLPENTNEDDLLSTLKQIVEEHNTLKKWKYKQEQQQVDAALAQGLIQEEEKDKYKTLFRKDFETAERRLHALREKTQQQPEGSKKVAQFMHSIQASVPLGAVANGSSPETGDSVYQQLLKHEPKKLKTLQQQDPAAFRQLLEAHLTWKQQKLA